MNLDWISNQKSKKDIAVYGIRRVLDLSGWSRHKLCKCLITMLYTQNCNWKKKEVLLEQLVKFGLCLWIGWQCCTDVDFLICMFGWLGRRVALFGGWKFWSIYKWRGSMATICSQMDQKKVMTMDTHTQTHTYLQIYVKGRGSKLIKC